MPSGLFPSSLEISGGCNKFGNAAEENAWQSTFLTSSCKAICFFLILHDKDKSCNPSLLTNSPQTHSYSSHKLEPKRRSTAILAELLYKRKPNWLDGTTCSHFEATRSLSPLNLLLVHGRVFRFFFFSLFSGTKYTGICSTNLKTSESITWKLNFLKISFDKSNWQFESYESGCYTHPLLH